MYKSLTEMKGHQVNQAQRNIDFASKTVYETNLVGPTDSVEVKTAGSHKAGSQRASCVVQVPDPTAWKVTLGV